MRGRSLALAIALAGPPLAALAAHRAAARTPATVPYPVAEVWPTAVRFLRVDHGFPIREKDESGGYVLFDYLDGGKVYKSSLELISTTAEGRDATEMVLTINDLPQHYEVAFLDKLARKVSAERGTPAPPRSPKPPPSKDKDRGKDDDTPDAGSLPRPPTLKEIPRIEP